MKKSTPNLLTALLILAIPFAYAAYIYPTLPQTIPTHFNMKGEADGFGERSTIFLGPGILSGVGLFTFLLLSNIKNFDPKKFKVEDEGMFKKLALFLVAFLSLLGLIITFASTAPKLNITNLLLPLLGISFAIMGWYMPKIHQNYFAGFKLPWTLENVDNWNETHKVAGKIWIYGGIVQAIGTLILPSVAAFILFMASTFIMVIIPTVFSYRMFKKGNQQQ
ncbi:MAG: hypothetical protein RIR55_543 [Bacteroidota bacterium]